MQQALADIRQVVEGVRAAPEVLRLARKHGVEMPIAEQVRAVVFDDRPPLEAVAELMARAPKGELG